MFGIYLIVFAVATVWLSLYTFGLYLLGKRLALAWRTRLSPVAAIFVFAGFASLIDLPLLALEIGAIYKLTLLFAVWLMHAQPTSVGYWATCEIQRKLDLERWEANADAWVEDFENPIPACMRDFEEPKGAE